MSIGNLKTEGNKGNNFPYQLSNLQLLGAIAASVAPPGGLATEATLAQVLAAIQNGTEFEQLIVMDLGGVGCPAACPTYIQIRIWDPQTQTFGPPVYYNAAGAVVVPVGPLQFVNPQYVLDNMLVQLTAINADLDVALSTRNAEATQLLIQALLTTIAADTSNLDVALSTRATEATLALLNAKFNSLGQKASASSAPVVLSTEQEVILDGIAADLALIYTNLQLNTVATQNMLTSLATEATLLDVETAIDAVNTKLTSVVRTPSLQRISGVAAASIAAGARSASFFNAGPTDATVAGGTLKPGESITFDAGAQGDTLGAIAYVTIATGDLVITTVV